MPFAKNRFDWAILHLFALEFVFTTHLDFQDPSLDPEELFGPAMHEFAICAGLWGFRNFADPDSPSSGGSSGQVGEVS